MKLPKSPKINRKKINAIRIGLIPYNETINQLKETLNDLNKSNLKFKDQLRNNIVEDIVTLIEDTLKHQVKNFIDRNNLNISSLIKEDEITDCNLSKGTVVAISFNFQNLKELNLVYKTLLKLNFLETLQEFILLPDKTGANEIFQLTYFDDCNALKKNWDEFIHMIEHRHKITHTVNQKVTFQVGNGMLKALYEDKKFPTFNSNYIKQMLNSVEVFLFTCMILPDFILYFHKNNFLSIIKLSDFLSKKIQKI